MSNSQAFLVFDPLDNPMHLKKVGNWVITFISSDEQDSETQLAITHVMPRQAISILQPRCIVIKQTPDVSQWHIKHVECFDGQLNKEVILEVADSNAQQMIQNFILDLHKYDVEVKFYL